MNGEKADETRNAMIENANRNISKQQVRGEQGWRERSVKTEEKRGGLRGGKIRDSKQSTQQFPPSRVGEAVI